MRISDWSSDVCSSDLRRRIGAGDRRWAFRGVSRGADADGGRLARTHRLRRAVAQPPHRRLYRGHDGPLRDRPVSRGRQPDRFARRVLIAAFRGAEIGRAACKGSVCHDVEISVVAVSLKKKKQTIATRTYNTLHRYSKQY